MSVPGVEGAGEVSAPPAFGAAFDDYDVEAHALSPRAVIVQPRYGAADQSRTLARVDGFFRHPRGSGPPRLDLDECENARATCDQVDLDTVAARVACDDVPAARDEMKGRVFLAGGPEGQV